MPRASVRKLEIVQHGPWAKGQVHWAKGHMPIKAPAPGTGKKPKPHIKVAVPKAQMHSGNGMTGATYNVDGGSAAF